MLALVRYGRHAADGERISLQGRRLVVEKETAGRLERAEFDRSWVHVEPKAGDRSLITLSAHGRSVEVGRYVRPELRPALASEIRRALRAA
ncbi:putative transmembrane protein [Acidovorax delafieldii 2AN]|uniref:Putative transmembrane protein n=1 Tax=Acidovorax delafieldii 2AN TaxID=573060 RepID=C5T428_ACIDE|nr:putative transmembrane protein [Acidovorax delafieldii 2AN]